jgi:hypothetical protein
MTMDDTQRVDGEAAAAHLAGEPEESQGLVPVPVETPTTPAVDGGTSHVEDRVVEWARETAVRLKPVAIAAEEMTARALDLSAKGLAKAAAYLEQRRQARHTEATPGPDTESASPEL